jgi:hypothetical protein
MKESIQVGNVYAHHGGGKYVVLHVVEDSTNARAGSLGVVYVSLTYGKIKYRDLIEFTEDVEWPDGKRRPRFTLVEHLNQKQQ